MRKTLLYLSIVLVLAALGFAYLQYNKEHRDTASEQPAYILKAEALFQEYEADESAANAKYLDKLLLVQGIIAEMSAAEESTASISLETADPLFGISCQLLPEEAPKLAALSIGQSVKVKGICTGKLMDVVLVRCVLVE